jgi:hypothetical protein
MSSTKLNLAIDRVIHECHLTIKRDLSTMNLRTAKILLTKAKYLSEPLIRDREGLALQKPMKGLGFMPDMKISIELCNHFLIPIIVHSHNRGHSFGMTNINDLIDGRNVE